MREGGREGLGEGGSFRPGYPFIHECFQICEKRVVLVASWCCLMNELVFCEYKLYPFCMPVIPIKWVDEASREGIEKIGH